jgi:ABC-type sugar transport system substrate-binding protein
MFEQGRRSGWLLACVAGLALVGAGCGSDDEGDSGSGTADSASGGTGKLEGEGKKIVWFGLPTSLPYIKAQIAGAKAEAERLGYELQVIENAFDQTQEDQQVQQQVATGEKVAGFIWYPASNKAGINSSRQLSRVAPVVQVNQEVLPEGREYITAYAGTNNKLIGEETGKFALERRKELVAEGKKLRTKNGNMLVFRFPIGFTGGDLRMQGFEAATAAAPFDVLHTEPGVVNADQAYKAASQLVPKYKSEGIDFVLALNNDSANGVIKALKENGLEPGKDVTVFAGNCAGNLKPLTEGEVENCGVQAGSLEGKLAIDTLAQHLATGKVEPGVEQLDASPEAPELAVKAPKETVFMPYPVLTGDEILTYKLWGFDAAEASGASL